MRILDLFSGIGGFSLGLERAGMETVAFCEMKPHARAVLAKNFPGIPCHDDVTTYDFRRGEAEVITAGFPCQDISFAGVGAGLAGARSGLYREVIRAICLVRPKYAVLENVAALLSRGLDVVLGDMAQVGYDAEWHCIPASAVGAPHRRDRIWIIADAGGEQHESRRPPFSGALAKELSVAHSASAGDGFDGVGQARRGQPVDPVTNLESAYAASERCSEAREFRHDEPTQWAAGIREEMADTNCHDVQGLVSSQPDQEERGGSIQRQTGSRGHGLGWWTTEPAVGRVAYGVPNRVDRLEELGNAVVPQIPEIIGRAIMSVSTSSGDRKSES